MNSMRRLHPSLLSSTMTPRLHENPLAVLRCIARALVLAATTMPGSVLTPLRAWWAAAPHSCT